MYTFLGITLVLALLLTINATATMLAAGVARLCQAAAAEIFCPHGAEILFVMRIGPPVIAIVSIGAFMIPSYLIYEPHATEEVCQLETGITGDAFSDRRRPRDLAWTSLVARHALTAQKLAVYFNPNRAGRNSSSDLRLSTFISDHRSCRRVSPAIVYRRSRVRVVERGRARGRDRSRVRTSCGTRQFQTCGDAS